MCFYGVTLLANLVPFLHLVSSLRSMGSKHMCSGKGVKMGLGSHGDDFQRGCGLLCSRILHYCHSEHRVQAMRHHCLLVFCPQRLLKGILLCFSISQAAQPTEKAFNQISGTQWTQVTQCRSDGGIHRSAVSFFPLWEVKLNPKK